MDCDQVSHCYHLTSERGDCQKTLLIFLSIMNRQEEKWSKVKQTDCNVQSMEELNVIYIIYNMHSIKAYWPNKNRLLAIWEFLCESVCVCMSKCTYVITLRYILKYVHLFAHKPATVPELWPNRIMNSVCSSSARTDRVCLGLRERGTSGG